MYRMKIFLFFPNLPIVEKKPFPETDHLRKRLLFCIFCCLTFDALYVIIKNNRTLHTAQRCVPCRGFYAVMPKRNNGDRMGRPKKEKPNRKDGCYEIKATVGTADDGTPIRKSFYSTKSKEDARRKAEQYKVQQELQEQTGICRCLRACGGLSRRPRPAP